MNYKAVMTIFLSFFLFYQSSQNINGQKKPEDFLQADKKEKSWQSVYREFLLQNEYEDPAFPTKEIYLIDLNRDELPEMVILHSSGGSMGGYYSFFYYDGKSVKSIMDKEGKNIRCGTGLQMRFFPETNRLIFYHEMIHIFGNEQGTYGYLKELINENGVPCVNNMIQVMPSPEATIEKALESDYQNEDQLVSNSDLVLAQKLSEKEWHQITGEEYIVQKYLFMNPDESFMDYWNFGVSVSLSTFYEAIEDSEEGIKNIPTQMEIEELFFEWDNRKE